MLIVKLGGSMLTRRAPVRVFDNRWADWLPALLADHGGPLCLTHGLGTFGRDWMPLYDGRSSIDGARSALARTVQADLRALHHHVLACLASIGCPLRSVDPESVFRCHAGEITDGWLGPVSAALAAGEVPVLYGGTVLDDDGSHSVLSSDTIMEFVATRLGATEALWLSDVPGVFVDMPDRGRTIARELGPADLAALSTLGDDDGDVTGGMRGKLRVALRLREHGVASRIVSGHDPGAVRAALAGEPAGTLVSV